MRCRKVIRIARGSGGARFSAIEGLGSGRLVEVVELLGESTFSVLVVAFAAMAKERDWCWGGSKICITTAEALVG